MKNRPLLIILYLLCIGIIATASYYWAGGTLPCTLVIGLGLIIWCVPRGAALYCGLFLGLIVGHLVGVIIAIITSFPLSERGFLLFVITFIISPRFCLETLPNLICGLCEVAGVILGGSIAWEWAEEAEV